MPYKDKATKGKNISIYLNAENLQYLDQLCKLFSAGRSEVIQDMILRTKKASLALIPLLSDDKSPIAEINREEGVKLAKRKE
jgi:hypothetical protein